MKLLGAALILTGSALACTHRLTSARRERQALRELSSALELLARGIRTRLLPLPRLMERRGLGRCADDFFTRVLAETPDGAPLARRWCAAAETLPLRPRERETLARASEAFGETEEGVVASLLSCAQELREAARARESELREARRLVPTVCFGGGAMLIVLLL